MGLDPSVRRTLTLLSAGYALVWAAASLLAGPGPAVVVAMTGDLGHAGLFIAVFYVAAAVGASVAGRLMDRWGRRRPLLAAYLLSAAGALAAGMAIPGGSVVAFLGGVALLAAGFGAVNLSRLAAADLFPPHERGRAVAWVQLAAVAGAVAGPLLLVSSGWLGPALGRNPFDLVWFLVPPLLLVGAGLVIRAEEPLDLARRLGIPQEAPRAPGTLAAGGADRPAALAAVVSLVAAHAGMVAVMGVTGAALAAEGHGVEAMGLVMLLHFLGMFGLSRLVGRAADATGRRPTILLGLALLAAGGLVVATVPGIPGFGVGLLLVGLGWSFAYIGATVLLTDVTPLARRARALGRADRVAGLLAAGISLGGGWWYAERGLPGLGLLAIAIAAVPVVALVLARETRVEPDVDGVA